MKASNKYTNHNRTVIFSELPVANKYDLTELEVQLKYTENTNDGNRCGKAIAIDNAVIPGIIKAVNNHNYMLTACKSVLESLTRNLDEAYLPETKQLLADVIAKASS
jgi:hypothetical protein